VEVSADLTAGRQLAFLVAADRLKGVLRQTSLCDGSRRENSAEHSWHLALAAVVLAEHAEASVDLARVVRMVLVHDLVEIDAGDTFASDAIETALPTLWPVVLDIVEQNCALGHIRPESAAGPPAPGGGVAR